MKQFSSKINKNRFLRLKKEMQKNNLDATLISSIPHIIYLTNFSGFSKYEREVFVLAVAQHLGLTHETPEVLGYILTDGRYSEAVKTYIERFELVEISSTFPLEKAFKYLIKKHKIK